MKCSITEAIVIGNWSAEELAAAFNLTEVQVKDIIRENDAKLEDENITEEEYQSWCDSTDEEHGEADIA